jgi:hypothetical protein
LGTLVEAPEELFHSARAVAGACGLQTVALEAAKS